MFHSLRAAGLLTAMLLAFSMVAGMPLDHFANDITILVERDHFIEVSIPGLSISLEPTKLSRTKPVRKVCHCQGSP